MSATDDALRAGLAFVQSVASSPAAQSTLGPVRDDVATLLRGAGLDPSDPDHLRAFAIGAAATLIPRFDSTTILVAAALRPPVVPS